ncbi:MAG: hypothetical protein DSZ07_07895 [Sulfurovum sp.]|nr:MAG: hypothetical protein DSZ07_07895 [Sulfurovum sp.]
MKNSFYYSQNIIEEEIEPSTFSKKICILLIIIGIILFSIVGYIKFKGGYDFSNLRNYSVIFNPIPIQKAIGSENELPIENNITEDKILIEKSNEKKEIDILFNALSTELDN